MYLFALSDAVWLAVIGVFAMAVKEYFDRERAKVVVAEAKKVAEKQETMGQDIRDVKIHTNSLTNQLVDKTEQEALARGGLEEREKIGERTGGTDAAQAAPHPSPLARQIQKSIDAVPEKTAEAVVEKLKDEGTDTKG